MQRNYKWNAFCLSLVSWFVLLLWMCSPQVRFTLRLSFVFTSCASTQRKILTKMYFKERLKYSDSWMVCWQISKEILRADCWHRIADKRKQLHWSSNFLIGQWQWNNNFIATASLFHFKVSKKCLTFIILSALLLWVL